MGLQAIEAAAKDGSPVFLVEQDTGDMTTAHWAVAQGVSFQSEGASIAFSSNPLAAGIQNDRELTRNKQSCCACIRCCRSECSVAFHWSCRGQRTMR